MGYAGGSSVFNDITRIIIELHGKGQLTEEAGTKILTHVAHSLADQDWDTLDESYYEFPGNAMVECALKDVWPEIGSDEEDWDDEEEDAPMTPEESRRFESRPDFPGWDAL